MKVAIVGGATSWELAPFDDPEWEIWVLGNQLCRYEDKRIDLVFEIHEDLSEQKADYAESVVRRSPKLVVSKAFPIKKDRHTQIEVYPKEEVSKIIGGHLSSSPAYMLGYAVLKGAEEVAIYGCDMAVADHEYFKQRPDMYAWIGYCMGKGIKVTLPGETHMFSSTYDEGRDWNGGSGDGLFSQGSFAEMGKVHREEVKMLNARIRDMERDRDAHLGSAMAYEHLTTVARAAEGGADIKTIKEVTRAQWDY